MEPRWIWFWTIGSVLVVALIGVLVWFLLFRKSKLTNEELDATVTDASDGVVNEKTKNLAEIDPSSTIVIIDDDSSAQQNSLVSSETDPGKKDKISALNPSNITAKAKELAKLKAQESIKNFVKGILEANLPKLKTDVATAAKAAVATNISDAIKNSLTDGEKTTKKDEIRKAAEKAAKTKVDQILGESGYALNKYQLTTNANKDLNTKMADINTKAIKAAILDLISKRR